MPTAASTYGQMLLGDLQLECGGSLHNARMGYMTWGEPSPAGDNAVILPSYYSGTALSYAPWVEQGESQIFDPSRFFVVAYDQLGAGHSSRPSSRGGYDSWSGVTCADSVRAARMLMERLGVRKARLVMGWSMGGMQAYAWAALYPGFADAALALCATPGCEPVNQVFLRSIRPMLDMAVHAGSAIARWDALRAFGAAYAGWAYSEEFVTEGEYEQVGYGSIQELVDGWAKDHSAMDAGDLLAQLDCWLATEAPRSAAAGRQTRVLSMPGSTDRYFPASSRSCLRSFPGSHLEVLDSSLGHVAGRPGIRAKETEAVRQAVSRLLSGDAP